MQTSGMQYKQGRAIEYTFPVLTRLNNRVYVQQILTTIVLFTLC